jgi:RNA polymerase sigma factor for flagellar operon FliA
VAECLSALPLTRAVSWETIADVALPMLCDRPDRQAESAEQKQVLSQGIAQLPERERLVVSLYYLEDLRLKEIAAVLELSESRVSRLLKTALFDLAEYMRTRESA